MFSYEFCQISQNTFYYRTPLVAAFKNFPSENNIPKNLMKSLKISEKHFEDNFSCME